MFSSTSNTVLDEHSQAELKAVEGGMSAALRISLGLAAVTLTVLIAAAGMQLIPRSNEDQNQRQIAETTAHHCSLAVTRGDTATLRSITEYAVKRYASVDAAIVVCADGRVAVEARKPAANRSQAPHTIRQTIYADGTRWGSLTVEFSAPAGIGWTTWATRPVARLGLFLVASCCLLSYAYLRQMFGQGDESQPVPPHIRATLDSLTQGLVVLDEKCTVLLANNAFALVTGKPASKMEGQPMDSLPWVDLGRSSLPWDSTVRDGTPVRSQTVRLLDNDDRERILRVNSAPLLDRQSIGHGVLVSFDDITTLEERNAELTKMLRKLRDSRDQVHRQNQELHVLATRDPLTYALNRRSFFEQLKNLWSAAVRYQHSLSCVMLDLDHFKQINDTHGHVQGDNVLKDVACVLARTVRNSDFICRYGGEEFCILLPHLEMNQATEAAERFRQAIQETDFDGIRVTASVGVSSISGGADAPENLIDQADQALYEAKSSGRNRVVGWKSIAAVDEPRDLRALAPDEPPTSLPDSAPISFQTVSALTSALAYRDAATAEHSRRVADLCVRLASDMMRLRQSYLLENAALLHDIGKIGVPDSILLKPGPLTAEEWVVMRSHDRIGREIIRSTFNCEELTNIVQLHHAPFAGDPERSDLPCREEIPLGARILAIADSYDAMVTDRVYRKGRTTQEAFQELRRCGGEQFDPDLVERFIELVGSDGQLETGNVSLVNKQVAIQLGVQIENLARALDEEDVEALAKLTTELKGTTATSHLSDIAELADRLNHLATGEAEWVDCLAVTLELLECCRQTQRVHLGTDGPLVGSGVHGLE